MLQRRQCKLRNKCASCVTPFHPGHTSGSIVYLHVSSPQGKSGDCLRHYSNQTCARSETCRISKELAIKRMKWWLIQGVWVFSAQFCIAVSEIRAVADLYSCLFCVGWIWKFAHVVMGYSIYCFLKNRFCKCIPNLDLGCLPYRLLNYKGSRPAFRSSMLTRLVRFCPKTQTLSLNPCHHYGGNTE